MVSEGGVPSVHSRLESAVNLRVFVRAVKSGFRWPILLFEGRHPEARMARDLARCISNLACAQPTDAPWTLPPEAPKA
jgi:hypothetical protein